MTHLGNNVTDDVLLWHIWELIEFVLVLTCTDHHICFFNLGLYEDAKWKSVIITSAPSPLPCHTKLSAIDFIDKAAGFQKFRSSTHFNHSQTSKQSSWIHFQSVPLW